MRHPGSIPKTEGRSRFPRYPPDFGGPHAPATTSPPVTSMRMVIIGFVMARMQKIDAGLLTFHRCTARPVPCNHQAADHSPTWDELAKDIFSPNRILMLGALASVPLTIASWTETRSTGPIPAAGQETRDKFRCGHLLHPRRRIWRGSPQLPHTRSTRRSASFGVDDGCQVQLTECHCRTSSTRSSGP